MLSVHPMTFVQSTPSTTWTISHGYATNPAVSVKVMEAEVLTEILPQGVAFPDNRTVVITFSSARTGEARLA